MSDILLNNIPFILFCFGISFTKYQILKSVYIYIWVNQAYFSHCPLHSSLFHVDLYQEVRALAHGFYCLPKWRGYFRGTGFHETRVSGISATLYPDILQPRGRLKEGHSVQLIYQTPKCPLITIQHLELCSLIICTRAITSILCFCRVSHIKLYNT